MSDSITTEPLAVELLLSQDARRSSDLPDARRDFIESQPHDFDDIDFEVAGNPAVDHAPETQGHGKTKRVLAILDELEMGGCR